jgi:hypothetical protein
MQHYNTIHYIKPIGYITNITHIRNQDQKHNQQNIRQRYLLHKLL